MMLQNELNHESVGIYSTVSSEDVTPNSLANKSAPNRISGDVIRGVNGSGNERGVLEPSGISTICYSAGENPQRQIKEEVKHVDEKKKEKTSCTEIPKTSIKKVDTCQFSEPKLLTSLKIIESLHSLGEKSVQVKHHNQDPQISKKAARKVNIPFEDKIYKDLIDLHVNNEDLGLTNYPIKPKEIIRTKEPEPALSDYYQPKFNKEYVIKPKVPTFEMTKFRMPELLSVYQITKRWEPDD